MKCKVYGIQDVSYVNKQNKQVDGTSIHILRNDIRVEGQLAESIFVSDRLDLPTIRQIKLGDTIDVFYNRYGSIDDIVICK